MANIPLAQLDVRSKAHQAYGARAPSHSGSDALDKQFPRPARVPTDEVPVKVLRYHDQSFLADDR